MQTPEGISAVDTELVANYVEQHLLTDAEIIQRVVRQNRTLGHRILRFINGLLGKIGFRSAKERAFLLRARSLYNAALNETQSSFRRDLQQKYDAQNNSLDTVRERYESGELSEAEAAAEHDRLFDPELYMEQRSGDPAFSIEKTTDNRPFVQIDEDILQGVPKSEWGKVIRQTLAQKFPNGIPLWNNIIQINQGSRREAAMVVLRYEGAPGTDWTALVGKGLMFDAGGYHLKSIDGMKGMKYDMCGAAEMLEMMEYLVTRKVRKNVMAVLMLAENVINSDAVKMGDVITTLAGKTVEV